jgi:hypothetical protein
MSAEAIPDLGGIITILAGFIVSLSFYQYSPIITIVCIIISVFLSFYVSNWMRSSSKKKKPRSNS